MDVKDITRVYVEGDGRIEPLNEYVLVIPKGKEVSISYDTNIPNLISASMVTYDAFIKAASHLPRHELKELCNRFDLDEDLINTLIEEVK